MASDKNKYDGLSEQELNDELKKLETEMEAVAQAKEVLSEVVKQRENAKGIESPIQDETIPDYIGVAGEKAKKIVEKGLGNGKTWITRAKDALNKGIHTSVKTAPKVVQAVKEAPGKIDSKIQEAQMAHARDKFEKRKNRKTLTSKKEDLLSAMKYKISEFKRKGKEAFARNIEISRAYTSLAKDYIKSGKDKVVKTAKQLGTETKVVGAYTKAVIDEKVGNVKTAIKDGTKKTIKGVKGFVQKVDKKVLEAQMAHARDKIEKRKNRKTLTSKKEDLLSVMKYKISEFKRKGKESFARNIEISKAYAGIVKDYVKPIKDHIVQDAKIGTAWIMDTVDEKKSEIHEKVSDTVTATKTAISETAVKVAETTKDLGMAFATGVTNAAQTTGAAIANTASSAKRTIKRVSKNQTGRFLGSVANKLGNVIEIAGKLHDSLQTKSNQLIQTPDIQPDGPEQSMSEEVK